jgi:hypothetical protein
MRALVFVTYSHRASLAASEKPHVRASGASAIGRRRQSKPPHRPGAHRLSGHTDSSRIDGLMVAVTRHEVCVAYSE